VVKTFRFSSELADYINSEGKQSNISASSFVSEVLSSYRDRYQFVERLNPVALTPGNFLVFLECISDDDLRRIAPVIAGRLNLYLQHIYQSNRNHRLLDWSLMVLMPQSHWFSCDRSNDGYMITHQMGHKWTVFLEQFLSALVTDIGEKLSLKVENEIILLKLNAGNNGVR